MGLGSPGFRFIRVTGTEAKALEELSKELGTSEERVFIQALRFFQLCKVRGYDKLIEKKEYQYKRRKGLLLKYTEPCWHEGIRYIGICDDCGFEEDM